MEAFLRALLPGKLPEGVSYGIYPHQGKQDLLRKLPKRLRGYATWLPAGHRLLVVVDRDQKDCKDLKSELETICKDAGLRSRRVAGGSDWQLATRVVIEELEAWYFGDWSAVVKAYPGVSDTVPNRQGYRKPDEIKGGTCERFAAVLKEGRYHRQDFPKIEVAGKMGALMEPERNISPSFRVFWDTVLEAASLRSGS